MPIVHANILSGRSQAQKAAFAKAITEAAQAHLNVPATAVRVLINEVDPDHWFTAGQAKSAPASAP